MLRPWQVFSGASLLVLAVLATQGAAQQLAFPSAEGFGRFSSGGRGGKAYHINSLAAGLGSGGSCNTGGCGGSAPFSAGTITLGDCLSDRFNVPDHKRTCIFRLGGIINYPCTNCALVAAMPSNMTIAGQTAPGDGIMIKNMQLEFRNTSNHIVRHLRVRPSETVPSQLDAGAIQMFDSDDNGDTHTIIVDHASMGWNNDDTTGGFGAYAITYQWCLISEGLRQIYPPPYDQEEAKIGSPRGKGNTPQFGSHSYLHNYFANYWYRVPNAGGADYQWYNNVYYNIGGQPAQIFPATAYYIRTYMDFLFNYIHPGPHSTVGVKPLRTLGCGYSGVNCTLANASKLNMYGNVHTVLRPDAGAGSDSLLLQVTNDPIPTTYVNTNPYSFPTIPSLTSAAQAKIDVLAHAGAYAVAGGSATVRRDSIDQRSVNNLLNCADADGSSCSGLQEAFAVSTYGGYPLYNSGTPYPDTDGDGISDAWETAHSLNPNDASDGPTITGSGYSNLELFLNELAGDGETPPTEPLIAHYTFENTLEDVQGTHDGTGVGSPTYAGGHGGGQALNLDGSTQYVTVPDAADLDLSSYTLAAWVYPTSAMTTFRAALVKSYTYYLYPSSTQCGAGSVMGGHTTAGGLGKRVCDPTPLPVNTWTHLAATYDGTTVRLYRNGVEVGTPVTTADPPNVTTGLLQIGCGYNCNERFPGRLDDVRVYNSALSQGDIQALSGQPPSIAITAPNGGNNTTVSTSPLTSLEGTASDPDGTFTVTVSCSPSCGTPTVTDATTSPWSVQNIDLTQGDNTITARVTDDDGLWTEDTIMVTYQPAVSGTAPFGLRFIGP